MTFEAPPRTGWRAIVAAYQHAPVRAMLFLGYASGLPILMVLGTLSARLRQSGIDRSTIGYFSLVGLAYSYKFFWSPIVDRWRLPLFGRLGRRRGWTLFSQFMVLIGLVMMALHDPAKDLEGMAWLALFTAFFAATQDIAVDAYRVEAASKELQASMAAAYQLGYQLALICAGAGALFVAQEYGWTAAYCTMAALMTIGVITTILVAEPAAHIDRAVLSQEPRVLKFVEHAHRWPVALRNIVAWLIGAVVCPFADFFSRNGTNRALLLLALVAAYRLNYTTMGVMAYPFYLDLGFTLGQIAAVSKVYGVIMTLGGAAIAGVIVARQGIQRALLVGCALIGVANLGYAYIADIKPGIRWLIFVISVDNIANGIAGTAFIAYMSSLTNVAYTATQYALFGTLWSLPAKILAAQSGKIVDAVGYRTFFIYTAALSLPALFLILTRAHEAADGNTPDRYAVGAAARLAGWIWAVRGVAGILSVFFVAKAFGGGWALLPALVGALFLLVGVRTIRGDARDTLANGIGSIFLGLSAVGHQFSDNGTEAILAVPVGFALIAAGIAALAGRSDYKSWRLSKSTPV